MVTQTPASRCSKSHRLVRGKVRPPESRDSRPGRQEIEKPRPAQIRIGAPSHVMKRSQLKAWFSAVLRKAKKKDRPPEDREIDGGLACGFRTELCGLGFHRYGMRCLLRRHHERVLDPAFGADEMVHFPWIIVGRYYPLSVSLGTSHLS